MNYPGKERRQQRRRETDEEQAEIVEGAVDVAPIVTRLLRTGKVASATLAIGAVFGGAFAVMGMRVTGPRDEAAQLAVRIDSNSARIARVTERTDSLLRILSDVRSNAELMAFVQCVQLRRTDSDLRPKGCDEAVARGNPQPTSAP